MPGVDSSTQDDSRLTQLWYVSLEDYIIDLAWAPDGTKLAAATVEGAVFLIDEKQDASPAKLIGHHSGGANSVTWRHDGKTFSSAGQDGLAKIWDGASGQELASLEAGDAWVSKVAYAPSQNVLATAAGRQIKLWNEQHAVSYESSDHSSSITDLGWNPDGSAVAVSAYNGVTLHVPGKQSRPRKYVWKGSSIALAWSPDSKFIATGEQDATVHFWHVRSGEDCQMSGFATKVLELSWNSNGRWLATGGGATVSVWDCGGKGPSGRTPRLYDAHTTKLTQVAFQPDGELLVSADADSLLYLWDTFQHKNPVDGLKLPSPASCLRWSKGGKLAVGQEDGKVVVFYAT
ncbi:MAG: WD40 repeat domain-containing protein [Verrucomicrobiota bacterium]